MRIARLYRYPVKGLSPERLSAVSVDSGGGIPNDRRFALLHSGADFDPAAPVWLKKNNFVVLMLHEELARLKTRFDEHETLLHVQSPEGDELRFHLDTDEGRAALERFMREYLPEQLSAPPRLLEAEGHQFTDKAAKLLSVINLASVRELEKRWGVHLDPVRFRANVYIDGAEPFSERDWIGRGIQLGGLSGEVQLRTGRCAATSVNPDTGLRDCDIPAQLIEMFGHRELGVYVSVTRGGELREGDGVNLSPATEPPF